LRGPARRVLAALIRQAQAGEQLGAPAADAAEAREVLHGAILAEARAEGLVEARPELPLGEDDGQRGLPAPQQTTHGAEEGAGMLPDVSQKT
jgi:hypothetical protein